VGIVASRLTETYYRPTIVLTESNGQAVGSARSVKDFNVYDAIDKCSDLLTQFGGHFYAAGLTMPIENIPAFKLKFNAVVSDSITKEQLQSKLEIADTIDFRDIFEAERNALPKFYRVLKQFAPFGPDNMHPIFVTKGVQLVGNSRLLKDEHIKCTLKQEEYSDIQIDAIGFNLGHFYTQIQPASHSKVPIKFDVAYAIEENNWKGKSSLQLMIKDIKINEGQ
jgi:single-stranded-DNA-specific exonuclease